MNINITQYILYLRNLIKHYKNDRTEVFDANVDNHVVIINQVCVYVIAEAREREREREVTDKWRCGG